MQIQQLLLALVNTCGIDTFFISPGSRNYELIEGIQSIQGITTHVHYDERGLSFFALGYAIATKKIAAIVVTSGTAVGLLLPAVMEAYHSGVTLLLLTADRPASLQKTGANQTCDQKGIYSTFTNLTLNLDLTKADGCDPKSIALQVRDSYLHTPGPIHLNCQLKAPVPALFPPVIRSLDLAVEESVFLKEQLDPMTLSSFLEDEKALLLIGRNIPLQNVNGLRNVHIPSKCTVVTDLLSSCRGLFSNEIPLKLFLEQNPSVTRVLHLGGSFIDTSILNYLEKQTLSEYIQVSSPSYFFDPHRKVTHYINSSPWHLIQGLAKRYKKSSTTSSSTYSLRKDYLPHLPQQGEFLRTLLTQIEEDTPLFVSNSTLIRDFDDMYYPETVSHFFCSNRGLSGSDGNIATFAGLCLGFEKKCIGFVGDIAFLHDSSSLPLLQKLEHGAELYVFNNRGGDIFRRLKHSKNSPLLESHYATAHKYNLSEIAKSYGLDCREASRVEEIEESKSSKVQLWEVVLENIPSTSFLAAH